MNYGSGPVLLALALGWARAAEGADRMVLPPGEDPQEWAGALSLAGLALDGGDDGRVVVEASASGWTLRAEAGGQVRAARIAAPTTAVEREEVAFLAQGLLRQLQAPRVGPALPPLAPPPLPPPPVAPVASAAVASAPAPAVSAAARAAAARATPALAGGLDSRSSGPPPLDAPALAPAGAADDSAEGAAEGTAEGAGAGSARSDGAAELAPEMPVDAALDVAPVAPLVDLDAPPDARVGRVATKRRRAQSPALHLSSAATFRADAEPGATVALGWDLLRVGRSALGVDLGFQAFRDLHLYLERQYGAWDARVSLAIPLAGTLAIAPEAGVSYRLFRQQWTPIDEAFVPLVGARVELGSLKAGKWHLGPIVHADVDLARVNFVLEDGRTAVLSPVEAAFGLRLRFDGSDDPFGRAPTSIE